jgi:hypothetical protein
MQFNEQQQQFLGYAQDWIASTNLNEKMMVLSGFAGTGKTTVVAHFLKTQDTIPLPQILICAPTHKAKRVLGKTLEDLGVIGFSLASLHQGLGLELEEDEDTGRQTANSRKIDPPPITKNKLVIIDECGMIGQDLWSKIIQWLPLCKKILFLGDIYQLPPINSESDKGNTVELSPVFNVAKIHYLTQVMRNSGAIGLYSEYCIHLISRNSNGDELQNLPYLLGNIPEESKNLSFLGKYQELEYFPELKFLASTNKKVRELNAYARENLGLSNSSIAVGEELVFYSPFQHIGKIITNGSTGVVKEVEPLLRLPFYCKGFNELPLEVIQSGITNAYYINLELEDGDIINIPFLPNRKVLTNALKVKAINKECAWRHYYYNTGLIPDLVHTYALTVHKSQGSTHEYICFVNDTSWGRTFPSLTPRLHYVAISRAKKFAWVAGS